MFAGDCEVPLDRFAISVLRIQASCELGIGYVYFKGRVDMVHRQVVQMDNQCRRR